MHPLLSLTLLGICFAGLYYFWTKARVHGLNLVMILLCFIFWPIGVCTGLYWGVKDYLLYQKTK